MNLYVSRQRAERLLSDLNVTTIPVPVEKIARSLKLDIVLTDLGEGVSGLLVSHEQRSQICIQKADPRVRRRFTIAHEIGHHYLGHQFAEGEHVHVDRGFVIRMRSPRSSSGLDLMEIEANQFAASLLMPEKQVREAAGTAPIADHVVARLARDFDVSEQAMTIRLTVLDLL